MNNKWVLASECPYCHGYMSVRVFYSYARNYRVRRNGQPYKRYTISSDGEMDICTVECNDCGCIWDGNNAIWASDGVFIRGDGMRTIAARTYTERKNI